jgi:hypothetical protein
MSNEQQALQTTTKTPIAMGAQGVELTTLEDVFRAATLIHKSNMAPKGSTVEDLAVAIMKGKECGMPTMYAVQSIAVINGRPSMYGDVGLALVRASGNLEYIMETQTDDPKNAVATCEIQRYGYPRQTYTFSQNDAIVAGLWGKQGPWKTNPKRMLMWRARWFALRDQFGDVLAGMTGIEEREGETVQIQAEVMESETKKRPKKPQTLSDVTAAMAETAPEPEPEPQPETTPEPAPPVEFPAADELFEERQPGEDDE